MKLLLLGIGICLSLSESLMAQEAMPQAPTLKVYSNLVQVPVFAVMPASRPIPDWHFSVSLDSGPPFPTSYVHLEGDDPITLAILLDVSNSQQRNYDDAFLAAMATMAKQELHPVDRVSIYSMDCQLVRTADNIPADQEKIKHAVEEAIRSPEVHHHGSSRTDCLGSPFLLDSISYITRQLATRPGRRVILSVTDGYINNTNSHKLAELRDFVNMSAVAIFSFSVTPHSASTFLYQAVENAFSNLVQMSGGWLLTLPRSEFPTYFAVAPRMLRRRYIVEFLRPDSLTVGPHSIVVTITDANGTAVVPSNVRPAGLSFPIADPAVLNNPSTVPSDPAQAPTVGDRHILTPH